MERPRAHLELKWHPGRSLRDPWGRSRRPDFTREFGVCAPLHQRPVDGDHGATNWVNCPDRDGGNYPVTSQHLLVSNFSEEHNLKLLLKLHRPFSTLNLGRPRGRHAPVGFCVRFSQSKHHTHTHACSNHLVPLLAHSLASNPEAIQPTKGPLQRGTPAKEAKLNVCAKNQALRIKDGYNVNINIITKADEINYEIDEECLSRW